MAVCPHYSERLAGAIDPLVIERRQIIDGRQIVRREVVIPRTRCIERRIQRSEFGPQCLRKKIVQAANPRNQACQRLRNARLRYVRKMGLALDIAVMNLGSKRALHLLRCALEHDPVAALGDLRDREPLRLKPRRHLAKVSLAGREAVREIQRREPLPILWRTRILLSGEQFFKSRLLLGRGLQQQMRSFNGKVDATRP